MFVQMLNAAWVQCERPDCLKWRAIPKALAQQLSQCQAPWFCSMNPSARYNSCTVPEEHYSTVGVKKCRLSFVTSVLQPGSLVLAHMVGYCRYVARLCVIVLLFYFTESNIMFSV